MAYSGTPLKQLFTEIADSIRAKSGGNEKIVADNFPEVIEELKSGGDDGGDSIADEIVMRTITSYSSDTIIEIGVFAFRGCNSLISVDSQSVTTVWDYAFSDCTSLTRVDMPYVSEILYNAFAYCESLAKIDLPSISRINDLAFQYCNSLVTVIIRSDTVPRLMSSFAFTHTPIASGTGYIYVPSELVDSYKTATNWSTYAAQIRAIEDYPDICG